MYLSYSGYNAYHECPRQYYYRYILQTQVKQTNQIGMLYGTAVGFLFEKFYAEHLWRARDYLDRLHGYVEVAVGRAIQKALKQGVVTWGDSKAVYQTRDELVQAVKDSVVRGVKIIAQHALVGKVADAEVKLDTTLEGHTVGGRADFILRRGDPHNDLVILDGKGSRWREKYVHATQLRWYAMLHQLKLGELPDKLGFIYWQFEPPEAVGWVPVIQEEVDALKERALVAIGAIEKGSADVAANPGNPVIIEDHFPAHCGDRCRLCAFVSVCSPGSATVDQKKVALPVIPGVSDLGLD